MQPTILCAWHIPRQLVPDILQVQDPGLGQADWQVRAKVQYPHSNKYLTEFCRYYAVPRAVSNQQQTTKTFIAQQTRMLNEILNEFSPPKGEIPTSFNYVQVRKCV